MKLLTIHPTHLFYWRRKLSPGFFSTVALFNCLSFFPEFNTSFNFFKVIRSHMNRWFPQVDMNPFCLTLNHYVSGTRMIPPIIYKLSWNLYAFQHSIWNWKTLAHIEYHIYRQIPRHNHDQLSKLNSERCCGVCDPKLALREVGSRRNIGS